MLIPFSPESSYLLDPYDRSAGPAVMERIAAAAPLDAARRTELLEHMLLASERRLRLTVKRGDAAPRDAIKEEVRRLAAAHHVAMWSHDPQEGRRIRQGIRDVGVDLLRQIGRDTDPPDLVELCFVLHDVESGLNRHGAALYYVRMAATLLARMDETGGGDTEVLAERQLQALRAEAVTYHSLHLSQLAYERCEEALTTRVLRSQPVRWKTHPGHYPDWHECSANGAD